MEIFRSNPINITLNGDRYKGAPPLGVSWRITQGADLGCHTKAMATLMIEGIGHNPDWTEAVCRKYLGGPYLSIDDHHQDIYVDSVNKAIYEDVTRVLGTQGTIFILSDRVTRETGVEYTKTPCIAGLVKYWAELGWIVMGSPITSNANYHKGAVEKMPHLCQAYFCWPPTHFDKVVAGTGFVLNDKSMISKEDFEEHFSTEQTCIDDYTKKKCVTMNALTPPQLWRGVLDLFKDIVVKPKLKEEAKKTKTLEQPGLDPLEMNNIAPPPPAGLGVHINMAYYNLDDVLNQALPAAYAVPQARGVLRPATPRRNEGPILTAKRGIRVKRPIRVSRPRGS